MLPPRSLLHREIAGRDQQNAPPERADVLHSAPSHPPTARGRPNATHQRFTPARRPLVAALILRAAHPRAPNSRMHAVTRRLHIAPSAGTLVAATAAPRRGTVNSARSHPRAAAPARKPRRSLGREQAAAVTP